MYTDEDEIRKQLEAFEKLIETGQTWLLTSEPSELQLSCYLVAGQPYGDKVEGIRRWLTDMRQASEAQQFYRRTAAVVRERQTKPLTLSRVRLPRQPQTQNQTAPILPTNSSKSN
jgi:hypothetical protein